MQDQPNRKREYDAARYRANREEIKARSAAYAAAHPEEVKARGAAYREANREEKLARDVAYYAANRDERLAYQIAYREANPEKLAVYDAARNAERYRAFHAYVDGLKADGCIDCGAKLPPKKLHWHHLDPATKAGNVSLMVGWSREKLDAEIAKCVLVCYWCHRKRHKVMRLAQSSQ